MPEEHVTDQPSAGSGHLPALPSSLAGTMTNYVVKRYAPEHKHEWDKFVSTGKNATFLFRRDYMDYHNERFTDHSLMVFHKGRLVALLPANLRADGSLASHDGLTYGGLVVSKSATLSNMLASLFWVLCHLHQQGITRLFYKRIPSFYNTVTDGEVDYALFLLGAQLCRRDNAMVIKQAGRLAFRKGRKSEVSKARRAGVRVVEEDGFGPFWKRVLIPRLASQYGVTPVHTLDEITLLAARFPDYIKQFSAYCDGEVVAGATVYETPQVAHVQYIAVTTEGRKSGALDYLFDWLIARRYANKAYFDFGICNENEGRTVNHGLLRWKEGFGARCHAQDFYKIATKNFAKLESVLRGKHEQT
jgi:hypothetical protein